MYSELTTLQNLQRFITLLADELGMVSRFKIVNTLALDNLPNRQPTTNFRSYYSGTWLVEEPGGVRSKEELLVGEFSCEVSPWSLNQAGSNPWVMGHAALDLAAAIGGSGRFEPRQFTVVEAVCQFIAQRMPYHQLHFYFQKPFGFEKLMEPPPDQLVQFSVVRPGHDALYEFTFYVPL